MWSTQSRPPQPIAATSPYQKLRWKKFLSNEPGFLEPGHLSEFQRYRTAPNFGAQRIASATNSFAALTDSCKLIPRPRHAAIADESMQPVPRNGGESIHSPRNTVTSPS